MSTLIELYENTKNRDHEDFIPDVHATDKWLPWHTYLQYYEKDFQPYKKNVKLLEVGVCWGGSIRLWTKYFEKYDITGVDITTSYINATNNANKAILENDKNVKLFLDVNSRDKNIADKLLVDDSFDIIIEDGDHSLEAQIETFRAYFPKLKKTGMYFIEDVQRKETLDYLLEELKKSNLGNIKMEIYEGFISRADDIIVKITHA